MSPLKATLGAAVSTCRENKFTSETLPAMSVTCAQTVPDFAFASFSLGITADHVFTVASLSLKFSTSTVLSLSVKFFPFIEIFIDAIPLKLSSTSPSSRMSVLPLESLFPIPSSEPSIFVITADGTPVSI